MIGKAKVSRSPAPYRLEVTARTAQTLPAQPRGALAAVELSGEARWYAGDFHVHSEQSGDAAPSLGEVATFARSRGLDFVHFAEHNTNAGVGLMNEAQSAHPALLLIPGVEFTTYRGHANGIGATQYVDHRLGLGGVTVEGALAALKAQGALVSINHPLLDLDVCIGCAWQHRVPEDVDAVEVGTGGWDKTGVLFGRQTLAWWERLVARGLRPAPIGGSDDHRAGTGTGLFDSHIGSPTTLVYAEGLSVAAILEGVRRGHTVVKLQGPEDPFVDLRVGDGRVGDEVSLPQGEGELSATVSGGVGSTLVLYRDGEEVSRMEVDREPFLYRAPAQAGRFRAVVEVDGAPRTVTNTLWVTVTVTAPQPAGCGCGAGGGGWVLLALASLARRRPLTAARRG